MIPDDADKLNELDELDASGQVCFIFAAVFLGVAGFASGSVEDGAAGDWVAVGMAVTAALVLAALGWRLERQLERRALARGSVRAYLIRDARMRGVAALRCERCGTLYSLEQIGSPCSAPNADYTAGICGNWDLAEIEQ